MYFVKKVEDWKMITWGDINEYIKSLKDWIYSIDIKKRGDRSLQQNRYYRGVVIETLVKETWNSPEELHYFFKNRFIYSDSWLPSSKELNKEEFADYVNKIIDYSAWMGIIIPQAEI